VDSDRISGPAPRAVSAGRDGHIKDIDERLAWLLLGGVVLLATVLCVWGLNSGLWYDEIATLLESVRQPLGQILTRFPSDNDHPLYSVLAHVSIAALGEHPWTLRLPAMIFGIACVPMLFVLGRTVASRLEGLMAALVLAVSYHQVWFSQNARAYTMMLFLVLLGTHLLVTGLKDGRRAAFAGFGVAAALAAYAHLTMVTVAVADGAVVASFLLARRRGRIVLQDWLGPALGFVLAAGLTLALYAPLLADVHGFFGSKGQGAGVSTGSGVVLASLLQLGALKGAVAVVGLVLFAVGCASYGRRDPLVLALFLAPLIFVLAMAIVLNRPIRPRFFFFSAGFLLLIMVRGVLETADYSLRLASGLALARMARPAAPLILALGMAAAAASSLPYLYRYPKQDFDGALRFVEASAVAGDGIYTLGTGAELPYQRYYGRPWPRIRQPSELAEARRGRRAVWILYTFPSYLDVQAPGVMRVMSADCARPEKFRGTLEDGDVFAVRCPGAA
jgi:hypothetical protein